MQKLNSVLHAFLQAQAVAAMTDAEELKRTFMTKTEAELVAILQPEHLDVTVGDVINQVYYLTSHQYHMEEAVQKDKSTLTANPGDPAAVTALNRHATLLSALSALISLKIQDRQFSWFEWPSHAFAAEKRSTEDVRISDLMKRMAYAYKIKGMNRTTYEARYAIIYYRRNIARNEFTLYANEWLLGILVAKFNAALDLTIHGRGPVMTPANAVNMQHAYSSMPARALWDVLLMHQYDFGSDAGHANDTVYYLTRSERWIKASIAEQTDKLDRDATDTNAAAARNTYYTLLAAALALKARYMDSTDYVTHVWPLYVFSEYMNAITCTTDGPAAQCAKINELRARTNSDIATLKSDLASGRWLAHFDKQHAKFNLFANEWLARILDAEYRKTHSTIRP